MLALVLHLVQPPFHLESVSEKRVASGGPVEGRGQALRHPYGCLHMLPCERKGRTEADQADQLSAPHERHGERTSRGSDPSGFELLRDVDGLERPPASAPSPPGSGRIRCP